MKVLTVALRVTAINIAVVIPNLLNTITDAAF